MSVDTELALARAELAAAIAERDRLAEVVATLRRNALLRDPIRDAVALSLATERADSAAVEAILQPYEHTSRALIGSLAALVVTVAADPPGEAEVEEYLYGLALEATRTPEST